MPAAWINLVQHPPGEHLWQDKQAGRNQARRRRNQQGAQGDKWQRGEVGAREHVLSRRHVGGRLQGAEADHRPGGRQDKGWSLPRHVPRNGSGLRPLGC